MNPNRTTISPSPKMEGGKRLYWVRKGERHVATIRFMDLETLSATGRHDLDPHWALLHVGGRIDRFDTLSEARDQALKL